MKKKDFLLFLGSLKEICDIKDNVTNSFFAILLSSRQKLKN